MGHTDSSFVTSEKPKHPPHGRIMMGVPLGPPLAQARLVWHVTAPNTPIGACAMGGGSFVIIDSIVNPRAKTPLHAS